MNIQKYAFDLNLQNKKKSVNTIFRNNKYNQKKSKYGTNNI